MTTAQYRTTRHRGYSAGYDAGYAAGIAGDAYQQPRGDGWSYRDGYEHGYEDGQAIRQGQPMQEIGR